MQSAKYPAEGNRDNLRHAVARYDIHHPVVNDPEHRIWDSYAVSAWPTLVFVSPDGQVIGRHAGEVPFEALDELLQRLIDEYENGAVLSRRQLDLGVQAFNRSDDQLSFPGKVLAGPQSLFIADSGHHRIVVTDLGGRVHQLIGHGSPGLADGDVESARFYRPQGMALDADAGILYVADSENHAVRAVDLRAGHVRTVAGTGEQARRIIRRGAARDTPLSSPWDLVLHEGRLYIAMAGLHQLWVLDLASQAVEVWAGTGHENLRDGSRETAWLAQPMGLSVRDGQLYVSCAEAQAVRRIDLGTGDVTTLVGEGLFDFGDTDGHMRAARLQHNQDVAASDGAVYIADTYNNKIKALDLRSGEVWTYLGSGRAGARDGSGINSDFNEPTGLSLHEGTLFIADVNNHLIRTADLHTGYVGTLELQGQSTVG